MFAFSSNLKRPIRVEEINSDGKTSTTLGWASLVPKTAFFAAKNVCGLNNEPITALAAALATNTLIG